MAGRFVGLRPLRILASQPTGPLHGFDGRIAARAPSGGAARIYGGSEVDGVVSWKLQPQITAGGGLGVFLPGAFVRITGQSPRTLLDVLRERDNMPVTIGAKLESDLTDPIGLLGDCHRRIERFLGVIVAVAERACGGDLDAEQRRALDTALRYFQQAAPRHMADEEQSLFPRLRQSESAAAIEALRRLEQDHQTIVPWHAELDGLGRQWLADGRLEAPSAARFESLARQLQDVYQPHIAVEDHEVFPRARQAFDDEQLRAIAREMADRRGIRSPT